MFLIIVVSNFLWVFSSFTGGVYYEVEKDSATVNEMFYDLAKERYDKLWNEGRLETGEMFAWEPKKTENSFCIFINGKDLDIHVRILKSLYNENHSMVILCDCEYDDLQRSSLCDKLSDGKFEHDYIAWQAFERDVLDELGLKYRKDWCDLIWNWYSHWFFKNQLYFIAVAMILYLIPCVYILLKKLYKNIFAK